MPKLVLDLLPSTSLVHSQPLSSSDPSLARRSSIVRQFHVTSSGSSPSSPPVIEIERAPTSSSRHSEQSLQLLSHHTSIQSATPLGDIVIKVERNRPSVLRHAVRLMSIKRKSSSASIERRHVLSNVGRTLQRTSSQLRRTRLFHLFYLFALPVYTVIGALIFQALDGEHDERLLREYNLRCREDRDVRLTKLRSLCGVEGEDCFAAMSTYLNEVEDCYRRWHSANRTITHSMNDFANSLVYAFSVYTTIGYGNMAADTTKCRVATIIYGTLGIPLFFAFIKEEGNLFRHLFITAYNRVRKTKKHGCSNCRGGPPRRDFENDPHYMSAPMVPANGNGNCLGVPFADAEAGLLDHKLTEPSTPPQPLSINNNNSIKVKSFKREYSTTSILGFGDVFPSRPEAILLNAVFIVLGVVLFSMCYFILQEEIREKAVKASHKARVSISKYSQSLIQHTRSPWSRRNSPLYDASPSPSSAFERLRRRRQSAPAVTLNVPSRSPLAKFRDI